MASLANTADGSAVFISTDKGEGEAQNQREQRERERREREQREREQRDANSANANGANANSTSMAGEARDGASAKVVVEEEGVVVVVRGKRPTTSTICPRSRSSRRSESPEYH